MSGKVDLHHELLTLSTPMIIFLSALCGYLILSLITHIISLKFSVTYRNLSRNQKIDWISRFYSSLISLIFSSILSQEYHLLYMHALLSPLCLDFSIHLIKMYTGGEKNRNFRLLLMGWWMHLDILLKTHCSSFPLTMIHL